MDGESKQPVAEILEKSSQTGGFLFVPSSFLHNTQDIIFKTVLSSGYLLILLSIEYILASLFETCQG